jgi:hydroxymethylglutaryl-CoA reductase
MAARTSRLPAFYKITIPERRAAVADSTGVGVEQMADCLAGGGLPQEVADKFVENVLGTYALPYGVVLNMRVNGVDHVVPMVVEEPSVVAAASNAAKMIRGSGGFVAETDAPVMTSQIQLYEVPDTEAGAARLEARRDELLALAKAAVPGLVERGGGPVGLEVRSIGDGMLVVHVHVDCRDAMGANLVNTIAEAIGERVAELGGGKLGLRILSNLCDRRLVRVRCRVAADALATETLSGVEVIDGIVNASRFAEADPYRAATHNKGIMNGIDAVVIATGNDWRAVEAGAHAYAARTGKYGPLAVWRKVTGPAGEPVLEGYLEMPLSLGTVGGTLRVHPAARLSLQMMHVTSAQELAMVAACVGVASNLAAIRALATDGIQRGHMALHARSVALAAGAEGPEVERVATLIVEARDITLEAARRALRVLRAAPESARPLVP